MKIDIRTNNHYYDLIPFYELPEKAKPDFDNEDKGVPRFVKYLEKWYDTKKFSPIPKWSLTYPDPLENWDKYYPDSYFWGTTIRFSKDLKKVQLGSYMIIDS